MGQKTHPFGFRVGITETHRSRWYAPKALYGELLVEDYKILKFVDKRLNRTPPFAAVADVHIERTREELKVIIKTARPGLVMGLDRGGACRGVAYRVPEAAVPALVFVGFLMMSQINQRFYWPEGTDSESIEGTRALPSIWEEGSRVMEISAELAAASEGLAAVAGDGLDAMRSALGPVGGACGACHDDYRASN